MRRALALVAGAAAIAACGGGDDGRLTVSAASSLRDALPGYAPDARYSFAGSDELAAQIRAGARPDVYVAASTDLPEELHAEGLVERPVPFASNRLVIAVPADSGRVRSLTDLAEPGTRIAVGSPAVPVGAYTRELLARLDPGRERAVLANVRSNEPDVAGVVGKLSQGAVDAGFVYATDVRASGGRLEAVALPPSLRPRVDYAAAVVAGTGDGAEAAAFVDGLRGAPALRDAGFDRPGRR